MSVTKNIEHHPDERNHPQQQPTLNHPQCHGRILPSFDGLSSNDPWIPV